MREIARDLGLSHNTIPQRFGTKQRLWQAAVDQVLGQQIARLIEALRQAPAEGLQRLRWLMKAFIRLSAERPQALQLVIKESAISGPRLDYLCSRYIDPSSDLARTLLSDLHRAGRIRTDDLPLVYFSMVHAAASPMVHNSLFRHLGGSVDLAAPDEVDTWADHVIDVMLGGLATPAQRGSEALQDEDDERDDG